MTRAELIALAERVEKAAGADRALDAEIEKMQHPELAQAPWCETHPGCFLDTSDEAGEHVEYASRYTASLDAAASLVPAGWRIDRFADTERGGWVCWLQRRDVFAVVNAPDGWPQRVLIATPALALTAAALRAMAAEARDA